MSRRDYLFQEKDLGGAIAGTQQALVQNVQDASEDYALNVDMDEWVAYLVHKHEIVVPTLLRDQVSWEDDGEVDIDVSHDPDRDIPFPGQRITVPGRRMVLHIPFEGEAIIFTMHATSATSNPPQATIRGSEVVRAWQYRSGQQPDLDAQAETLMSSIEIYLGYACLDVDVHNKQLAGSARGAINARRKRLLEDRAHLATLKIPIRVRADAPMTFSAAEIRRKRGPAASPGPARSSPPAPASSPPTVPDPTLSEAIYEHVLDVLRSAGHAIERAPDTYTGMGEEERRNVLLVSLNTHYEGDAVGEAFNRHGKTDILLRRKDENLFIAECKFWGGPATITKTLDQLLGYATWRDTKLALIIWVKLAELSQVIEKTRAAIEKHPAFKRWIEPQPEGELRAKISLAGDEEREAHLHVFLFHTPS
jgi:hypothetical protein